MATPAAHSFVVYQGQTWSDTITVKEPNGAVTNLTGFEARMHVREAVESTFSVLELTQANGRLTIPAPLTGKVVILVSAADMALLPLGFSEQVWEYDLEIYRTLPAPEYVQKILRGYIFITPEITR